MSLSINMRRSVPFATDDSPPDGLYTDQFYNDQVKGSLNSARGFLAILFEAYRPASVVDIGCGRGAWLKAIEELGSHDFLGIDGAHVTAETLLIDPAKFVPADLRNPIRLHRRFDLAICVEVAEHLPASRAESLVEDLTNASDIVLFSAAVRYQGGRGHCNEQWPEYWAILFRQCRFICYDFFRPRLLGLDAEPWYAQNAFLFVRQGHPLSEALRRWRADDRALAHVDPQIFLTNLCRFRPALPSQLDREIAAWKILVHGYIAGASQLSPIDASLVDTGSVAYEDVVTVDSEWRHARDECSRLIEHYTALNRNTEENSRQREEAQERNASEERFRLIEHYTAQYKSMEEGLRSREEALLQRENALRDREGVVGQREAVVNKRTEALQRTASEERIRLINHFTNLSTNLIDEVVAAQVRLEKVLQEKEVAICERDQLAMQLNVAKRRRRYMGNSGQNLAKTSTVKCLLLLLIPPRLRIAKEAAFLKRRGAFDTAWYLATYPDVAGAKIDPIRHYLLHGFREGRKPHPEFDPQAYCEAYPDVAFAGVEPFCHFVRFGKSEGRTGAVSLG
jgi:SAM-dependent methyltransferase